MAILSHVSLKEKCKLGQWWEQCSGLCQSLEAASRGQHPPGGREEVTTVVSLGIEGGRGGNVRHKGSLGGNHWLSVNLI